MESIMPKEIPPKSNLPEWVSEEMARREKAEQPAVSRPIDIYKEEAEKRFGAELAGEAEGLARNLGTEVLAHLTEEKNNQDDARRILDLWKSVSNDLFARLQSENAKDPTRVEDALKLLDALLAVDPRHGEDAKKIIEKYKDRF